MNYLLTQEELDALRLKDTITREKALEEAIEILSKEFSHHFMSQSSSIDILQFREPAVPVTAIRAGFRRARETIKAMVDKTLPVTESPK